MYMYLYLCIYMYIVHEDLGCMSCMGESTPILTILVDDGLLSLLAYLTVSHTHPKACKIWLLGNINQIYMHVVYLRLWSFLHVI